MIIDCHVYCLPDRLRDIKVKLPVDEIIIQQAIYQHSESEYALGLASPDQIIQSMKTAGVDRSILVAFPWNTQTLCSENNEYILQQLKLHNDFFSGAICSIQPKHKGWQQFAEQWIAQGAVGLKINPAWQGYELDDSMLDEVMAFALTKQIFVMAHIDHPMKKSPTSPAHLLNLCQRNSNTKILAAHMGGMVGAYALLERVKKTLSHVWFDTAISATLPMVKAYVDFGLEDKVIFGSDFPFNHCHDQITVVQGIKRLNLDAMVESKIFNKNFNRLITT